jgi:rRNA-processing protein FCF1
MLFTGLRRLKSDRFKTAVPQGVTAKLKALLEAEKELGKSTKIE